MAYAIRAAVTDDAAAISRVVLAALHETNTRNYGPETIARIARGFMPAAIAAQIAARQVFVALDGDRILGTASRDGEVVRAVFVTPEAQGRGIGRGLMGEVDRAARAAGVATLTLQSSLTAIGFYVLLGFRAVREHRHGQERTVVMERDVPTTA